MNVRQTFLVFSFTLPFAFSGVAQTAAKPAATTHKRTRTVAHTAALTLKTSQDSISYAIGVSLASFYKQQNITDINTAVLTRAVRDVEAGKSLMTEQQCQSALMAYVQEQQAKKALGNKKLGEEFLAANGKKPGVVTLPSGLQYQVITEGTGPKPKLTDMVRVHYSGTLIDGQVFDSSIQHGAPAELNVSGVIPGWTEALQLMPVGSKWRLFIPSNLAYGDRQAGPLIAPGSTLIFDVELLEIINKNGPPLPPHPVDSSATTKPDTTHGTH